MIIIIAFWKIKERKGIFYLEEKEKEKIIYLYSKIKYICRLGGIVARLCIFLFTNLKMFYVASKKINKEVAKWYRGTNFNNMDVMYLLNHDVWSRKSKLQLCQKLRIPIIFTCLMNSIRHKCSLNFLIKFLGDFDKYWWNAW